MTTILNLEPEGYSKEADAVLEQIGTVALGPLTPTQLESQITDCDVLIVRLGHQIDRTLLDQAKRLKVIVSATTGLNHIDLEAASEKNITVLSLRGERKFLDGIHATAEHTFALILSLLRKVHAAHADVIADGWNRDAFKGHELEGKTLGIVGLGRLGRKVAGYGRAFGMDVIAHDTDSSVKMDSVSMVGLYEIARADVVSLHIPSNKDNYHYINADFYTQIKHGAFVINTARGDVHDQSALLAGLKSGRIAGAALDVLEEENGDDVSGSPLIQYAKTHDNLLLTPHIGGATFESMAKTEIFMAEKLKRWLEDLSE